MSCIESRLREDPDNSGTAVSIGFGLDWGFQPNARAAHLATSRALAVIGGQSTGVAPAHPRERPSGGGCRAAMRQDVRLRRHLPTHLQGPSPKPRSPGFRVCEVCAGPGKEKMAAAIVWGFLATDLPTQRAVGPRAIDRCAAIVKPKSLLKGGCSARPAQLEAWLHRSPQRASSALDGG